MKRISGVDLSVVDGFGVSLAQTVIMEVGTDMDKFPDEKHFCSWLGLAPKHEISGAKVLKNKTLKTKNRAGQAFRMAAHSVKKSDCVFGALYRRLRSRLGPAQATVACAHAIARVVYRMLKYQVEYETISRPPSFILHPSPTCPHPKPTKPSSSVSHPCVFCFVAQPVKNWKPLVSDSFPFYPF